MLLQSVEKNLVPLQPDLRCRPSYREALVKWNPYSFKNLALCYEFRTGGDPEPLKLIPDACPDFLFRLENGSVSAAVSGLQTGPVTLELAPNAVYFGFKPYSVKGMRRLDAGWSELRGRRGSLRELMDCGSLLEELAATDCFARRAALVSGFAAVNLADKSYRPDAMEHVELHLCNRKGNLRMEDVADFTGYSGRYCREKFKEAAGVSMKRYSDIIRFQNVVRMLEQDPAPSLSDIVFENGYFDQSHLNREFKRFSGESPLRFRGRPGDSVPP